MSLIKKFNCIPLREKNTYYSRTSGLLAVFTICQWLLSACICACWLPWHPCPPRPGMFVFLLFLAALYQACDRVQYTRFSFLPDTIVIDPVYTCSTNWWPVPLLSRIWNQTDIHPSDVPMCGLVRLLRVLELYKSLTLDASAQHYTLIKGALKRKFDYNGQKSNTCSCALWHNATKSL